MYLSFCEYACGTCEARPWPFSVIHTGILLSADRFDVLRPPQITSPGDACTDRIVFLKRRSPRRYAPRGPGDEQDQEFARMESVTSTSKCFWLNCTWETAKLDRSKRTKTRNHSLHKFQIFISILCSTPGFSFTNEINLLKP